MFVMAAVPMLAIPPAVQAADSDGRHQLGAHARRQLPRSTPPLLQLRLGWESATGSDGCNRFTNLTASRSTISFRAAATTMMACPRRGDASRTT